MASGCGKGGDEHVVRRCEQGARRGTKKKSTLWAVARRRGERHGVGVDANEAEQWLSAATITGRMKEMEVLGDIEDMRRCPRDG